MNFKSDNTCGVNREIMEAIFSINHGNQNSYGNDDYSSKLKVKLSEIFEAEVHVYLTSTGTAANALALSALIRPYEFILCHEESHINTDECGAPLLFTGGSHLLAIPGEQGKLNINQLERHIHLSEYLRPHMQKPGCISITQATECGTIYSLDEIKDITNFAKFHNLPVHMDGARFANSLISLGCAPSEATWKSGIDVMSFGATKNGCINAEAIIFFNKKYTENFDYLHKRAGQLMSKTRFFAVQFLAYLENDLWLKNATQANSMASKLKGVFDKYNCKVKYDVQGNEVFPIMDRKLADYLLSNGCSFYSWGTEELNLYRFVSSCFTTEEDVNKFEEKLQMYQKIETNI